MWLGTDGGIFLFDGKSFKLYAPPNGLPGYIVNTIMQDSKGHIWIGTNKGSVLFNGNTATIYTTKTGLPDNNTWCIKEDHLGNIWFATEGGVCRFDGNRFVWFTKKEGLPDNRVLSILEDRERNIWMGTKGGLCRYDGKTIISFTEKDGLVSNMVQGLALDKEGNLWIGTKKGISKYINPLTHQGVQKPGNTNLLFKNYTYEDGFSGIGINVNAIYADTSTGNIWFGADDRITVYHPDGDYEDTIPPEIQVTNVGLFNETIPWSVYTAKPDTSIILANGLKIKNAILHGLSNWYSLPQQLSLSYKNNNLNFKFIGITMWRSAQVKYQYYLHGLEKNWNTATFSTEANYAILDPGSYTFKVKAMNSEGYWSKEFQYFFTIRPPWWQTWWFRSIAIALIIFSLSAYYRNRTAALRKRQKLLQKTVEERTEQLRKSLKEKEFLLKEIHHRVKNNLEVISSLLMLQTEGVKDLIAKAALAEGQSRVQSIALIHHKLYRNEEMTSVEFTDFVNDLYKQVHDLFKKPGNEVELVLQAAKTQMEVDIAVPLGLILNELFTNTFKYAVQQYKKNMITIHLQENLLTKAEQQTTSYILIYRDNGPGMPADFSLEKSTSLGVKVIQLLTKQIGGKLHYHNNEGAVFEIPFKRKLLSQPS